MTAHPLPEARYVLYTHYPEGKDFKKYSEENTPPQQLDGVKDLVGHFKGLQELLTWPGFEGLLVLFFAPGFEKCLTGIARNKTETDLVHECKELEFARAVDTYLHTLVKHEYQRLVSRLRFVTALDLLKVFGRVKNSEIAEQLKGWMVGDAGRGTYDSPKIVEAIVRLRLLGSGIPIFRVDHDVLFRRQENWDKKNLEFSSTIGSCLMAYQRRRDSANLSSFIFSASYEHQVLEEPGKANDFHAWSRAFATRVFPALPVNEKFMDETLVAIQKNDQELSDAWDSYAKKVFRQSLTRKFFGFPSQGFTTDGIRGIGQIGAHPMSSVISGAMLYLSDGAILDLPPFSNFRLNASWIDDHLKYCLHRELRHLSSPKLKIASDMVKVDDLLRYSKLDNVVVKKTGRKIDKDLRKYIFDEYLPTLLRGAIMDAWINPDPALKYRPGDLSQGDILNETFRVGQSRGVLPSALQKALKECNAARAGQGLKERLFEVALRRINEVRRQWRELTEDGVETFASLWAKGKAPSICADLMGDPNLRLKYVGIAHPSLVPADSDVPNTNSLDGALLTDLHSLVNDANEYIKWALKWPTIVQVVRSIEQGTLRTDLNFDPEREERV